MNAQAKACREKETKVITKLCQDAIAAGFTLGVNNGEEVVLRHSSSIPDVLSALFSVDEEHLYFYGQDGKRVGWAFLVHGNDGYDVVCDASCGRSATFDKIIEDGFEFANQCDDR